MLEYRTGFVSCPCVVGLSHSTAEQLLWLLLLFLLTTLQPCGSVISVVPFVCVQTSVSELPHL